MHRLRIALALLALHALCSPAADIAPVVSWSVETNALQPSQRGRKDLEIVRGETVVLECQLLSGGTAINLAEATSVLLRYTAANPATNSTHYVVTGAVHSAANGKVRVRWTAAACPADDRLQYEIAVSSATSTVARAWGLLRLLPGVGDDSTGSAVERSTIDWSTVDSQNEGDGPWPVELADLDDVDTTGRSAGEVVGWNGTNHVYVAQGGHDPVTRGAGDIGTLVGQVRTVSTNHVRAAVSGLYLSLADGGTVSSAVTINDELSANSVIIGGVAPWTPNNQGAGSGLDADLLDGNSSAYFRDMSNANAGTLADARLSTSARTIAFHAGTWEGPTVSQTPGWAPKSYAVAGLNAVVPGPVGSATQAAGTFASIFQMPSDATAWRTLKAISLSFIGDSTTSTAVKYRLRVYRAGNNTALYDVADQVLTATDTVTTVDVAASSLGTCTADAVYTIVVDASVTASGFYFVGQPRVQVIR